MELTILMPCLNEAKTLPFCINKAKKFLSQYNIDGEILIADNGSTDNSIEVAESLGARVLQVSVRGYGAALLGGINASHGKYIIMGDSDDSYDFSSIMPFVEKLRLNYDLVMGNRFKGGVQKGAMPFLNHYLGNPVLTTIGRILFHVPIKDFHCGLRAFNKETVMQIGLITPGMEFASEMVIKAALKKLRITEVPVILYPDKRDNPPHLRRWQDGWRHLRLLFKLKLQQYFPGETTCKR